MQSSQQDLGLKPGVFQYRPVCELGEGGLGRVDAVQVIASNQSYAIGTYLARKRLNALWSSDLSAQARFDREIEILALMSHPNIVPLRGVNLPGGARAYFMPLFPNTLRRELETGQRWPLARVANLGVALANALSYSHKLGFTHRDLKPDNILLDAAGNAVLCDWGLGQFIHKHSKVLNLTQGGPLGTSFYCDLQQWSTGNGGVPGDIYSLGMTLAELALGSTPELARVGFGIDRDLLIGGSVAIRRFNAIVRQMTDVIAQRRPQAMADVANALQAVLTIH